MKRLILRLNYGLIIIPVMIFSLGFVTLLSSSREKAISQTMYFLLGILFYAVFTIIDVGIFRYFWKWLFVVTVVILAGLFLYGSSRLGSTRWVDLGIITIQPSEISKIALIFIISSYISLNPDFTGSIKKIIKLILINAVITFLVFIQPDLGSSFVLLSVLMFLLYFSGVPRVFFLIGFIIIGISSAPIWKLLRDYQKVRIMVFLNPKLDVLGYGYNVTQSIISIGAGGLLGKGFGQGSQTHMNFLPVHWTDFIFASYAEEWGFIGVIVLLALYLFMFYIMLSEVKNTTEPYSSLICMGIFTVFFIQFLVNIGMNLGILPVTGITLPLMSHGGSSLITTLSMLGIMQGIHVRRKL